MDIGRDLAKAYDNGYEQWKKDATQWISVKDRLPERDERVLACYRFNTSMQFVQVLDYYATDPVPHFQHELGTDGMKVTHWMPLPEPPKGE